MDTLTNCKIQIEIKPILAQRLFIREKPRPAITTKRGTMTAAYLAISVFQKVFRYRMIKIMIADQIGKSFFRKPLFAT